MPDYLASIDPGKHACGVAVWTLGGLLIRAAWVKNPYKKTPGLERVEGWGYTGRAVSDYLEPWKKYGIGLVMEIPEVYSAHSDKDKNDLIDLAGVQGAVIGAMQCCNINVEWSPLPKEWKGQLPKEISKARVDAKLSAEEKSRIEWPAESYRHNVYDALHLGLVHLEREGLRVNTK